MLVFKFVVLFSAGVDLLVSSEEYNNHQQCKEDLKAKSPFLADRFTEKQLEKTCKKSHKWGVAKSTSKVTKVHTHAQTQYLQHIRQCVGEICLKNQSTQRVTRKEYRTLTDQERQRFHAAINKLKSNQIDGESKYHLLVADHSPSTAPEAHWGCAFLPYHREFVKHMEVALRLEDSETFLPYWDSTLDQGLPNACDSVLFSNLFAGNANGAVTTGPFAGWKATEPAEGQNGNDLYRQCGESKDGDLYEPKDLKHFMSYKNFRQHCYCHNPTFESLHGVIHEYIGGHMANISLAPNDPIFFMHHAFIDCIWEEWRVAKQNRQERQTEYAGDAQACGQEYDAHAPMKPFHAFRNIDGLSNSYTDRLYTYSPRPSCPSSCTGPYLFCTNNKHNPRCLAKINVGGNCKGYEQVDSCYDSKCVNSVCVKT